MAIEVEFELIDKEADLLPLVDSMSRLADLERDSLGFWPPSALIEAIKRKSVIALVQSREGNRRLLGYIHHSGVFPHAKIQQIAVEPEFRKRGYASALLNSLIAALEKQGFLSLRADIAENLQESLSFYRSNGFVQSFARPGGKSRKRSVLVHQRVLDTDDLFSLSERAQFADLGIRRRSVSDNPIFAFDLNVYFDLVRERSKSDFARRIFAAALANELRLAVSEEFSQELYRTSQDRLDDPILHMALRLPKLPKVDQKEADRIADFVHDLVFVRRGKKAAFSDQALSDAKHVAHAALARASGFITRDGSLLEARDALLDAIGIDIIDPEEVAELLPNDLPFDSSPQSGVGFSLRKIRQEEFVAFLKRSLVAHRHIESFTSEFWDSNRTHAEAVVVHDEIVAVAVAICSLGTHRFARCLVYVDPAHPKASLFCDNLLDRTISEISAGKPIALSLERIAGQSALAAIARSKGFGISKSGERLEKFVLGHPLTPSNWKSSIDELRRCTGLILPRSIEHWEMGFPISVLFPSGETTKIPLAQLEVLLGPTVLVTPAKNGVLVPIGKRYADELLGTAQQTQFSFVANRDAAFTSVRGYVNSPHRSALFRPDSPILFYESKRTGGRGGVVAIAKITDTLVTEKSGFNEAFKRHLVVDDVNEFSSGENVLVTMFDNLMKFPRSPTLNELRSIGAVDGANLVSAKEIAAQEIEEIIGIGWNQ